MLGELTEDAMLSSTLPIFSHSLNVLGRTNLLSGLFVRRGSFSSVIRVQPGVSSRDTLPTEVPSFDATSA